MRRLLLLLVLVALGCGQAGSNGPVAGAVPWPGGPSYVTTGTTSRVTVAMTASDAADAVVRTRILDAVEQTVNAFELQEGTVVPPTSVGVTDATRFPFGEMHLPAAGGWLVNQGRPDAVLVTVGNGQTLPALYHELAHRTFHLFGHTDPRWPTFDRRGSVIAAQLAARPED